MANSNVHFAKTDILDASVRTHVPKDALPAISLVVNVSGAQRVILDKTVKNCALPVVIPLWGVTRTVVVWNAN